MSAVDLSNPSADYYPTIPTTPEGISIAFFENREASIFVYGDPLVSLFHIHVGPSHLHPVVLGTQLRRQLQDAEVVWQSCVFPHFSPAPPLFMGTPPPDIVQTPIPNGDKRLQAPRPEVEPGRMDIGRPPPVRIPGSPRVHTRSLRGRGSPYQPLFRGRGRGPGRRFSPPSGSPSPQ